MQQSLKVNSVKSKKNYKVGKEGEQQAINYLRNNGFSIIKSRYRALNIEIDIICSKGNHLHFIEVKTSSVGNAHEYLNTRQLQKYFLLAEAYVDENFEYHEYEIHFDAIVINNGNMEYIANLLE